MRATRPQRHVLMDRVDSVRVGRRQVPDGERGNDLVAGGGAVDGFEQDVAAAGLDAVVGELGYPPFAHVVGGREQGFVEGVGEGGEEDGC